MQKLRLLLVEDDENLGTLLREYLMVKSYEVDWFVNGDKAYKSFVKGHYDLCILDIMMPVKDGFTLAREIILDVKTPSSGESHRMQWKAFEGLRPCDAVKFVLADESDYRWSVGQVERLGLVGSAEVLFSPVHGKLDVRDLIAWIIRDRLAVRVNLQAHKYIWGSDAKGV